MDELEGVRFENGDQQIQAWSETLDSKHAMDRFLASIERRAYKMAQFATGNREDALDIVQDAMLSLVQHYSTCAEAEWGPLFQCILQRRINDWYRRSRVRSRLRGWVGLTVPTDPDDDGDPLANVPDPDRREHIRKRFERFKQLRPWQQERLRKRFEWYRALPPSEREALRDRWRRMPPQERRQLRHELREGRTPVP